MVFLQHAVSFVFCCLFQCCHNSMNLLCLLLAIFEHLLGTDYANIFQLLSFCCISRYFLLYVCAQLVFADSNYKSLLILVINTLVSCAF